MYGRKISALFHFGPVFPVTSYISHDFRRNSASECQAFVNPANQLRLLNQLNQLRGLISSFPF